MPKLTLTGESDNEGENPFQPPTRLNNQDRHQHEKFAPQFPEVDKNATAKSIEHMMVQTIDQLATSFAIEPGLRVEDASNDEKALPSTVIEVYQQRCGVMFMKACSNQEHHICV